MADVRNDLCLCGKSQLFETKEKAWDYINKQHAKGFHDLANVHPCRKVTGIWHVTSKAKTNKDKLSALARELHVEMATVKDQVVQYIKHKYERSRGAEYKCTTSEIRKDFEKKGSYSSVSVAVSSLKREGIITELDEKDPTRKGPPSYMFTLTSILEEVTKPKKEEKNVANEKVPAQPKSTPVTVAANPFDKVNERLDLILAQLRGLSTGYSQVVENTGSLNGKYKTLLQLLEAATTGITREESVALNAINDLKHEVKNKSESTETIMDILKVIQDEIRFNGKHDSVADKVNERLTDLRRADSFIYRMREELDDRISKTEEQSREETGEVVKNQQILRNVLEGIRDNISVPSSVANPDDYRAGIKEGIRLAVEMGLMVKPK